MNSSGFPAADTPSEPDTTPTGAPARGARALFWKAQAIGWLLFGVVRFLSDLPQSDFPVLRLFGFKMLWATVGLALSSGLAQLYRRVGLADRGLGLTAAVVSLSSAMVATGWVLGLGALAYWIHGATYMMFSPPTLPVVVSNHFFILLAWSAGYLMMVHWHRSQERARMSLVALSHARAAQLEMLRYQLNPHFLFNAMTSVRALIAERPDQARETLTRLSEFLRYTLTGRDQRMASVAEEIEIVRDYLAIEQVRFEERLASEIDVDPAVLDERIPIFLVHTLVENAVKHGEPQDGQLTVRLGATVVDGRLRLEVANTGRLGEIGTSDEGNGRHLGLVNVRRRLAAGLPNRHSFRLAQDGDWVRATIDIDLESSK